MDACMQEELAGPVDYRHAYLPMANLTVAASRWTRGGRTCAPAMGMSFAAGTTDGAPTQAWRCRSWRVQPHGRTHTLPWLVDLAKERVCG